MRASPGKFVVTLLVLLALGGAGYGAYSHFAKAESKEEQGGGKPKQAATQVTVAPVARKSFSDGVEALGTTRANETVVLTAKLSETVNEILFEDGQQVKKDDVLIVLDSKEEQANLAAAQALAAEKQSAFNRSRELERKKIVSREDYESKLSELKSAEAQVESIRSRIQNATVTAPFDGVLGLRNVSIGALVQPGDAITTIDDLSRMKVDFEVPAIFLNELRPGLPVVGQVEAFGDRQFKGEVNTVNTQVDPVTRAVRVRAIIPNDDLVLRPGLLMNMTLDLNPRQALVVPEGALLQQRDVTSVFVAEQAEDGKTLARKVNVERGNRRLGEVEILKGLEEGQQVIVTGLMSLTEGQEVKITDHPIASPQAIKPAASGDAAVAGEPKAAEAADDAAAQEQPLAPQATPAQTPAQTEVR